MLLPKKSERLGGHHAGRQGERHLPDSFVHGCLTPRGAYAVYEENVCLVGTGRAAR